MSTKTMNNYGLHAHNNELGLGEVTTRSITEISRAIGQQLTYLGVCLQVYQERRALTKMTDTQLTDIGLGRGLAMRESARGFFDLPANRLG